MNTETYAARLNAEHDLLVEELETIAVLNPTTHDWEVRNDDQDTTEADSNAEADDIESSVERASLLSTLEPKYRAIRHALDKIEAGTYGRCEICQEPIEEERLMVNPSARTCERQMEEEGTLPLV